MWLEAILSREDLRHALNQFAPVTVKLGDGGGTLFLDTPSEVQLEPDKGLRVVCRAKLHWPLLGIDVPLTLHSVGVLVEPVVERHDGVEILVFKLKIEHADFAGIPSRIDQSITERLNAELEKKHVELAWNFSDTLSQMIDLPNVFEPSETLALGSLGGMVKTTEDTVGLAIALRADLKRGVRTERPPPSPKERAMIHDLDDMQTLPPPGPLPTFVADSFEPHPVPPPRKSAFASMMDVRVSGLPVAYLAAGVAALGVFAGFAIGRLARG